MTTIPVLTGATDNTTLTLTQEGSAPGTLASSDWMKWGKAGLYLAASAMVVGALNGLTELVAGFDWASFTLHTPVGIDIKGAQIGMGITNLLMYAIELLKRDTRQVVSPV